MKGPGRSELVKLNLAVSEICIPIMGLNPGLNERTFCICFLCRGP